MIAKSEILRTLRMLDFAFQRETSDRRALLISKQALLELCGWVEESMDDICLRYVRSQTKESVYYDHFYNTHVKKVHGFQYEQHFRRLLEAAVGVVGFERLERSVDSAKRDMLKNRLRNLEAPRNTHAHTHVRATTPRINAPSRTTADFEDIYDCLLEYQAKIRKIKYTRG